MTPRRHLSAVVLAVVAAVLVWLIIERVSAGPDPAPQEIGPIVIKPTPTPTRTIEPPQQTTPRPVPKPARTAAPQDDDDDDDDDGDDDD